MILADTIHGNVNRDASLERRYEEYAEAGNVEHVRIDPDERKRSRLRTETDAGTEVGIVVADKPGLNAGDVVVLDDERMIVVAFEKREALVIAYPDRAPADALVAATRLGHVIGNRHWDLLVRDGRLYVPLTEDRAFVAELIREELPPGAEVTFDRIAFEAGESGHSHEHGHDHPDHHDHADHDP
jgi:urease accessory protein